MNATTASPNKERTNAPTPTNSELLDVNAVAALLACSKRHVYRLSDAGRMPRPVRLGALVRWRRSDLVAWLDAGCPNLAAEGRRRG